MSIRRSLDFGSLVGAQLTALIDAEVQASERSWEFIQSVGFTDVGDGKLRLKQVYFQMERRDSDGQTRTHTVNVPALSLTPLPLLTVAEAELEFELNIDSVTTEETQSDNARRPAPGLFGRRRRLSTRLARKTSSKTSTESDLRMTVKIRQSDFPLGIEQLLSSAELSANDEQDD